jgi:hypothetical protein
LIYATKDERPTIQSGVLSKAVNNNNGDEIRRNQDDKTKNYSFYRMDRFSIFMPGGAG